MSIDWPVLAIGLALLALSSAVTFYLVRRSALGRLNTMRNELDAALQQIVDSQTSRVDVLETQTTKNLQELDATTRNLLTQTRSADTQSEELGKRTNNIGVRLSRHEGQIDQLQNSLERSEQRTEELAQTLIELTSELESQLNHERLGDIEQLAITAATMAGTSLHLQEVEVPPRMSPRLHGHGLMMYKLLLDSSAGQAPPARQGVHLLEIGTTREKWWEQMSTSRLAATCRALNYTMVTVDVDEQNSAAGAATSRFYGATVRAETARGEDYLRSWKGELPPYIYLDAYDFDHGKHSAERQGRYRELQGAEISDEACWAMHLECAEAFVEKCPTGGIVVFDDVFFQDNQWTGKGKTAVPYMLENGFELLMRSRQSAIFRRLPIESERTAR